jgi:predicted nucleotidyltransferase
MSRASSTPPLTTAERAVAHSFLAAHPPPGKVLLCGVVGSRLYGYARPSSDLDLKGIHQAPTADLLRLFVGRDTHERITEHEGHDCDLTTHELATALRLLLKGNGNILERIASPLQVVESPAVAELQTLSRRTLSKRYHGHYRGYFRGMQREYDREGKAKALLASVRLALTGTLLLQTGELQCDINLLAEHFQQPEVLELAAFQRSNATRQPPPESLATAVRSSWPALDALLTEAAERSPLPVRPEHVDEMDGWLIDQRKADLGER